MKAHLIVIVVLFLYPIEIYSQTIFNKWSRKKLDFSIGRSINDSVTKLEAMELISKLGTGNLKNSSKNPSQYESIIEFTKSLYFTSSHFLKSVCFKKCEFKKGVFLPESHFSTSSSFIRCIFRTQTNLKDVEFTSYTDFSDSFFFNKHDFSNARFEQGVNFSGTNFNGNTNFHNVFFGGNSNFDFAKFERDVDFEYAKFTKTPNFIATNLPNALYFRKVDLSSCSSPIRFDLAQTDSLIKNGFGNIKCKIYLDLVTDLNKIILDHNKFELAFDNSVSYEERLSIFELVLKKTRDMGFQESARGFDIELQKIKIQHRWPKLYPLISWFQYYWWNYGYEKQKIFKNTIKAYFFCFLMFFTFLPFFLNTYLPTYLNLSSTTIHTLNWVTRLKISLFYTALIFFSLKMEHGDVKYKEYPIGTLLVYTVYTIGIIHLAYLAGAILNK